MNQQEHENHTMSRKFIPMTSLTSGLFQEVADGVFCYAVQIVNIAFIETNTGFVMVDAGMPGSSKTIISFIHEQFGRDAKPEAIILTHGHFDHIGALEHLIQEWNIPIYAHKLELPYLTGQKNYPEPDGTVEGGIIAKVSPLFPNEGIDLKNHIQALPSDGTLPHLPDWNWIHTPGHSDGHISLFRKNDRTLIVGDAFVTVKQDSLYNVLVQKQEIHGPPRYLTTDWKAAKQSVIKLAKLDPNAAITGHGLPLTGEELHKGLKTLVKNFDQSEIPDHGKYI
ncbi:MBL fold metallo-hydrolase [Caldibacillus lycopersici]|uniref:MBL fold metallo-hydrolase n=1 Tax=Perspicuibacillus lycopersici TaxID=1325689 RepID=A0AAE3LR33_9BACI|nr:MBL fold metallo-hydrolase [Perspicuibacillus lycopersici]MCU9614154.1 MBL fold metallo-hydrolase [Perspicuibacillus lycopersici]